jgi:sulfite exporter TauE/SafE
MSPLVPSAFLMGLFGGAHCVAMCGGVVGVLCGAGRTCEKAEQPRLRQAPYWLAYNGGRVAAYTLLGLLFGSLGTLSTGVFPLDGFRIALRGLAAVCMLAVGLHLAGLPSMVKTLESVGAPLWRKLAPVTQKLLPIRTLWHALGVGALWGLMPCGLLYGALALAASAESPSVGAMTMLAFGLGTLPVMLTVSALAQSVARWTARVWVRRIAGAVVLAFGLWTSAGLAAQTGVGASLGLGRGSHACCPTKK